MKTQRALTLLKAAYDLLKQADDAPCVLNPMEIVVHYDDADCDGNCLMEDIEHELRMEGVIE